MSMRLKAGYFIPIVIGLCIMALVCAVSWLYRGMGAYNRSPDCRLLDSPVSLAVGTIRTPEFDVPQTAMYGVEIQAEGNGDIEKIQCLMGLAEMDRWNRESQEQYAKQCRDLQDLVDISWELLENGRTVEAAPSVPYRGNSHDHLYVTLGPGPVIREIGMVWLLKGHSYSLALTVKRDASQLNAANPRIRVTVPAGAKDCVGFELTEERSNVPGGCHTSDSRAQSRLGQWNRQPQIGRSASNK